ncbi:MAG: muramoyltetrapeptide carboxypeptidase [Burkholderiaceae bacterium]
MQIDSSRKVGVALVAPSGYPMDPAAVERGIAALEAHGCRVVRYFDRERRHQRFGGTDAERAAQLMAAAADPDVQVVLAVRGGYGLTRILPQLDFERLAASGKLFVGHSDFTAFQMALLAQTGACSFAGPMLCDDFTRAEPSRFTLDDFWRCIGSGTHTIEVAAAGNPALDVSGTLWGGNLTMLTHLAGTRYLPRIEDGILFVEDVNEHPYRVERMLLQLQHAGVLGRQQALLLGDFSNYRLSDYDNGYDFDAMLAYLRAHCPIPVLTGLPFGHIADKATLAVGAQAELAGDGARWQLRMTRYPTL